ncbi:MAG: 50S ribosomal protein L3 [Candidatus Marinamargulisbacteria bacterium]|jgi:large subunit ribosomal protein L3|nr:50S ribosomal protein L3 [bacterium]MDG2264681.1 50S ribosomal protein L3 [Candidatus Marinamargulisbacteria bacterium]|tara:strand:- start:440 stop:1084 length:645 start_codon:yes stop_codon:yes gene_type:complete
MKKVVKKLGIFKKVGMTQLIMEDTGNVVSVTALKLVPSVVMDTSEENETDPKRIVLGYGTPRLSRCTKPHMGQFKKRSLDVHKWLTEVLFDQSTDTPLSVGESLSLSQFVSDERVFVRSKSKGRGFSGTIRRWNFRRGPETHGSKSHRITGSIGGGTTPGRVLKGKKMAGQYGNTMVTVQGLRVVRVDESEGLLFLAGGVPGAEGGLVVVGVGL